MKKIPLTKNQFALIDDEDFEKVNQYKWHAFYNKSNNSYYAYHCIEDNNKRKNLGMHRLIMNCPDDMQVDHRDHQTLDNRKYNLRIASKIQNSYNRKPNLNCKSRFKGVNFYKNYNKWVAEITYKKKHITIGYYFNEIDAAKQYNKYAEIYFKEFAYLNKI